MESPKKILTTLNGDLISQLSRFYADKLTWDTNKIKDNKVKFAYSIAQSVCSPKISLSINSSCGSHVVTSGDCNPVCNPVCGSYCSSNIVCNPQLLQVQGAGCGNFTSEDFNNLLKSSNKMNTMKIVSMEIIEKVNNMIESLRNAYIPPLGFYVKNFSPEELVPLNLIIEKSPEKIEIKKDYSIPLLVQVKNKLSEIQSYCPCNSNRFQDTGGCSSNIVCYCNTNVCGCRGRNPDCSGVGIGCGGNCWCNGRHCNCNILSECNCQSNCPNQTCPCDCFGYIV